MEISRHWRLKAQRYRLEGSFCPVCGQEGKGRIGKWGFEEWVPTRWLCTLCDYVYDEKRGEPHRGIKPGTKFEDLPDDFICPECGVGKDQFSPE